MQDSFVFSGLKLHRMDRGSVEIMLFEKYSRVLDTDNSSL